MNATVAAPLVRPLRWYLTAYAVTMVGTGMVFPLNAIFLGEYRGLNGAAVAAYYVIFSVSALIVNPIAAVWADRNGPFRPFVIGLCGQAAGMSVIALVDTPWAPLSGALIGGVGGGMVFASQTAVVTRMFGVESLTVVFGRQYQISNLSLAGSALVAGLLVEGLAETGYVIGYLANAVSFVVFGTLTVGPIRRMLTSRGLVHDPPERSGERASRLALAPYRDRRFLPVILLQFCLVVFGLAQLEAVIPVVLRTGLGLPVLAITLAFMAVNGLVVVVAQKSAIKWVVDNGHRAGLRVALLLWIGSCVPASLAVFMEPLWLRITAVAVFSTVFAIGEVFVSPSLRPLAATLAPDDKLAVYTASTSMAYSIGLLAGPALLLPFYTGFGDLPYWITLALGALLALWLLRLIPHATEPPTDPMNDKTLELPIVRRVGDS